MTNYDFIDLVFVRIFELLLTPKTSEAILWTIAPLIFFLVMSQMYFGRYKTEPLGWNSAYANTISLVWVTAILLRHLDVTYGLENITTDTILFNYFALVCALGLMILTIAVLEFYHKMPKNLAYIVSSSLPTNIIAYFIIIIIMGKITIDLPLFFACIILFIFFSIIFTFYKHTITPAKSALPTLKKHEEEHKKKQRKLKRMIKKKVSPILEATGLAKEEEKKKPVKKSTHVVEKTQAHGTHQYTKKSESKKD